MGTSGRLVSHRVLVHADDYLIAPLDGFLILVRRVLNLALWEASFDSGDHAAHRVDLAEVVERFLLHLFCQRFQIV
jgi:hypothetical protein